ncbi:MAG: hypothetical protein BBJ60_07795 [Desulfobacterales bacterium S7086C20]|nr:MAG: hypothetical protein BBJ60_07795 [Desulfobacterales bacterium S7086C20]
MHLVALHVFGLYLLNKLNLITWGNKAINRLRPNGWVLPVYCCATSETADKAHSLIDSCIETRVVLLPVDPYLVHVYWEVNSKEIDRARYLLGDTYESSQALLRFYDVTNVFFDGTNANSSFDVKIDLESKSWYVRLWVPDKSYVVELGYRTTDGSFFSLAQSNTARTPRAWPVPRVDDTYSLVDRRADDGLATTEVHTAPHGGDKKQSNRRELTSQTWETEPEPKDESLTQMNEEQFSFGMSSYRISSIRCLR